MQRFLLLCAILVSPLLVTAQPLWNPLEVDLTRTLTRDLFESNAVPYVQPMVTTLNATSNARFYDHAYVPKEVDAPYIKVSANGMFGLISDQLKTFTPGLDLGPHQSLAQPILDFLNTPNPGYDDTLSLVTTIVRELFRDAQDSNFLTTPPVAATLFGYMPENRVGLPSPDQMTTVLHARPEYQLLKTLDPDAAAQLDTLLASLTLPPSLTMPPGVDMSTIIAAVPQFEIGCLWGTEALVRFIPPVEFDPNVGEFSFWGFGLKHSVSQYFPERWFDMAVQAVYQGTNLTNTVGFTESKLEASATIWSGNVHISKEWWEAFAVYTGLNYEYIDVTSTYTYVLPQEVQIALGLLPAPPPGQPAVPTPEQPGDQSPQVSVVTVDNTNIKWTIGATVHYAGFRLAVDYSVSSFNIFSAGLSYQF